MSGWGSAIKKPWAGVPGGATAITPAPRGPKFSRSAVWNGQPDQREDEVVYSEEEKALCGRYYVALTQMATEDRRYQRNADTFRRWDTGQQLKWIYVIEQQALDELNTIGVHVVTRVIMNRLE